MNDKNLELNELMDKNRVEEVLPAIFKISVPLPKNPLKAINSYILKSNDRNLIIDTGFNRKECKETLQTAIDTLNIDLNITDFFITHMHADHSGLANELSTPASKIYISNPDGEIINGKGLWSKLLAMAQANGFPEKILRAGIQKHPGYKYGHMGHIDYTPIKENDIIRIGSYKFSCIATPGHTRGHMCLYERDKEIFISGDHILGDITPNIAINTDKDKNPLKDYYNSLDKVFDYNIKIVLPGHRSIIDDHKKRICELKTHHKTRLEEVTHILTNNSHNAYIVAAKMRWDIKIEGWEHFPIAQKWFATFEALAHLRYLEEEGILKKITKNGIIEYIN